MKRQKVEAVFITKWKNEMRERIKLRFKDKPLNEKKINQYLDKKVKEYLVNPEVEIVNNYRGLSTKTDLLSLIDLIEENQLIIGGGGVLFVQHNTPGRTNIMFGYITNLKDTRNNYKAERKKYKEDTDIWIRFDIFQNNTKTKVVHVC